MHTVSRVFARNLHRKTACVSALWINPEADDTWREAQTNCETLRLLCQDRGTFSALQSAGANVEFAAFPSPGQHKYDWIILNLPRQKELLGMLLACAAGLLASNGSLWLAGENKAGIKSADKRLRLHFRQVKKLDKARHCVLFEAREPLSQDPFEPASFRTSWTLECGRKALQAISYPGVFAHGRLDAGTAMLLSVLADMELHGDVLDFASGAGVIGACIGAQQPQARVTLLDSNALALRACAETLASNALTGTIMASDGLAELSGSFDFIVSNPPIHTGIKTDSQLSIRLLEGVHEYIRPGGALILVANVHLPYEKWLKKTFKRCTQKTSDNHYKVILADR